MEKKFRILSILECLAKSSKVSVKELVLELDASKKVIQSDFEDLKDYFGDNFIQDGAFYTLVNQDAISQIFKNNPETTRHFLRLVFTVDSKLYGDFIRNYASLLKELKLTTTKAYQIIDNPYEHLNHHKQKLLDELEDAILNRNYLSIRYHLQNVSSQTFHHSIPLKIIYLGSNWYLATLTTNDPIKNHFFRLLRINFIAKIAKSRVEPIFFHNDNSNKIEADRFLKSIQTAFSNIKTTPYKVTVKVSPSISRYFKSKKYLTSQRVIKELEDDSILVSYMITNDMEIIPMIQRWMPFVEVIEPLRIKEKIIENIEKFTKGV